MKNMQRQTEHTPDTNPWRPIDEAPRDHIIEGRFSSSEEEGRPIRCRKTRRRTGPYAWEYYEVWHAAETAGAIQLHPTEWREWQPAGLHFPEPESSGEAEASSERG